MPSCLRWCSKPEAELASALDRLIAAGLLFRQGVPPHASYLFKHALVQDAAYGTLLREPRRALHARIAETLESQFAEIAENQPELLARHCTEAGLIEKAAGLWGKAGQRSLERSALVEAVEQLTRALDQIATLPATPALRREQIKLQVALITPLIHVKGYAAPETKAAAERARLLIEQAEALGEPPEDPLLLFSVLYGFWVANFVAFNGDAVRELAAQFLALAEKQGATVPAHDRASPHGHFLAVYGRHRGRPSALRSSDRALRSCRASSAGDAIWRRTSGWQSCPFGRMALWLLGYPEAALADADRRAQGCARDRPSRHVDVCADRRVVDSYSIAEITRQQMRMPMNLSLWRTKKAPRSGRRSECCSKVALLALTGKASDAVQMITSGISRMAVNGSNIMHAVCIYHIWRGPMRNLANLMTLGAALAKR